MTKREQILKSENLEDNFYYILNNAKTLTEEQISEHKRILYKHLSPQAISYINMEIDSRRNDNEQTK